MNEQEVKVLHTVMVKWALPVSEGRWWQQSPFYLPLNREHTHSSGEWVVSPQPSLSMKAVFQSLETALPQRESSSLILRLTSHWRWCNSMKVINHLPKLRPHLSCSLWAPKLLLRASDGCMVRGCSSLLRQVQPTLTFPLLSLASYSHRTYSPDKIIQFLIVCVCGWWLTRFRRKNRGCSDKVRLHTTAAGN